MGVETAILGSALIGGATSLYGASEQADAADASLDVQRESLNFEKERYDDWYSVYGELQEDLGTYYKNLTGEELSQKNLQAIQDASQKSQENIDKSLAQRGLDGSGLEAQLTSLNTYNTEMQKANVRANADEMANQEKMQFLSLGLGQGDAIAGQITNTYNGIASTYNQQASYYGGMANSGIDQVQSALGTYSSWTSGGIL